MQQDSVAWLEGELGSAKPLQNFPSLVSMDMFVFWGSRRAETGLGNTKACKAKESGRTCLLAKPWLFLQLQKALGPDVVLFSIIPKPRNLFPHSLAQCVSPWFPA